MATSAMPPERAASGLIELTAGEAVGRLDQWLARELGLSRAAVQRAIAAGRVSVEGALADKSTILTAGALVRVQPEEPASLQRPAPPVVTVLYADAHLALIDKPAGLPVYANAGQTGRATLADALRAQFSALATLSAPEPQRPGMVHRLDADTSGIMVIGLDADTVRALQRQFHQREPDKVYLALVHGHLPHERALIEAPIGRHPHDRTRQDRGARRAGARRARPTRGGGMARGPACWRSTTHAGARIRFPRAPGLPSGIQWWATAPMARGAASRRGRGRCCMLGGCA